MTLPTYGGETLPEDHPLVQAARALPASDEQFVLPDFRDRVAVAHDVCDTPAVDLEMDDCKHCGGAIVWGLSEKRRRIPLEHFSAGELTLLPPVKGSGYPEPRIYRVYEGDRIAVLGPRFRRHSESCSGKRRAR